ncbi:MAG: hypothetical protein J1E02_08640, partial [Coprobacter sp.]|nr:hypothetical protein [Coprobacter sp.]
CRNSGTGAESLCMEYRKHHLIRFQKERAIPAPDLKLSVVGVVFIKKNIKFVTLYALFSDENTKQAVFGGK